MEEARAVGAGPAARRWGALRKHLPRVYSHAPSPSSSVGRLVREGAAPAVEHRGEAPTAGGSGARAAEKSSAGSGRERRRPREVGRKKSRGATVLGFGRDIGKEMQIFIIAHIIWIVG